MKLSIAAAVLLSTTASAFHSAPAAFRSVSRLSMSTSSSTEDQQTTSSYGKGMKKQERRRIMASDSFHRMGFKDVRPQAAETMKKEYQSELVADMKTSNFVMERDGVRVHLAKVCFARSSATFVNSSIFRIY